MSIADDLFGWSEEVRTTIQSGFPRCGYPEIDEMTVGDRKKLAEYYASKGFSHDAIAYYIAGTEAMYIPDEERIAIEEPSKEVLAHEIGHWLGQTVKSRRLEVLLEVQELTKRSEERLERYGEYLVSEYFAERAKAALACSLEEEFGYDENYLSSREEKDLMMRSDVDLSVMGQESLEELLDDVASEIRSRVEIDSGS